MTDVINLKQQRKAKARAQKERKAAENRLKFGQTRAQKQAEKQRAEQAERLLEGHKRDVPDENYSDSN